MQQAIASQSVVLLSIRLEPGVPRSECAAEEFVVVQRVWRHCQSITGRIKSMDQERGGIVPIAVQLGAGVMV